LFLLIRLSNVISLLSMYHLRIGVHQFLVLVRLDLFVDLVSWISFDLFQLAEYLLGFQIQLLVQILTLDHELLRLPFLLKSYLLWLAQYFLFDIMLFRSVIDLMYLSINLFLIDFSKNLKLLAWISSLNLYELNALN